MSRTALGTLPLLQQFPVLADQALDDFASVARSALTDDGGHLLRQLYLHLGLRSVGDEGLLQLGALYAAAAIFDSRL